MKALLLALTLSSSLAFAGTLFNDAGTSSLKITETADGLQYDQIKTDYAFSYNFDNPMVFKHVTNSRWWNYAEGSIETTTVTGYSQKSGGKYSKKWTVKADGSNFKILDGESASITQYGCCGGTDYSRLLRLTDGKHFASAEANSIFRAQIPNSDLTEGRYLAPVADIEAPQNDGTKTYIGSIGYFSSNGMISLVRIYAGLAQGWGAMITDVAAVLDGTNTSATYDGMTFIDLWESDGKSDAVSAFEKFGLSGHIFYEQKDETFTIKVKGDKIDMGNSVFSGDLKAVQVF
jgi:hypothetical protein